MTEEEYIRMRNLLDEVIAQQARSQGHQTKTDEQLAKNAEQIARNTEGIAALLVIAQMHEQEMTSRFKETDDRINALVDVVERYITKGQ